MAEPRGQAQDEANQGEPARDAVWDHQAVPRVSKRHNFRLRKFARHWPDRAGSQLLLRPGA